MDKKSIITAVDKDNLESVIKKDLVYGNLMKSDEVTYITRLTRELRRIDAITKIVEKITPPDYTIIYNADDQKIIRRIHLLRDLIEKSTDSKRQEYIRELNSYEPDLTSKFAILIDVMLEIAEELDLGFGINNGYPYYFNGYYWESMSKEFAKEILSLVGEKGGFKYYFIRSYKRIKDMFEQFFVSAFIPEPARENGTFKINLKNGKLTITNGKIRFDEGFSSKDFFKYQLSCVYDPEAKSPKFQKYLDRVLPEKEAQMVIAEYLGYMFTDLKLEKCLVLVGVGHVGKSVIHDIINLMFGKENISSYPLNNLCNETGYYRAELANVILNYCSELGGKGCNPDTVKQLISGEPISCRSPYGAPFILRNYCKLMFNTNLIPPDTEKTSAYYRRFIFVLFNQVISKEEKNVDLAKEIFKEESSGILNWILEGLQRIVKNKDFTESEHIKNATDNIKVDGDSVLFFLKEERYQKSIKEYYQLKTLFQRYTTFCDESKLKSVGRPEFSRRLREHGYQVESGKTNNQTWVYCEQIIDLSDSNETDKDVKNIFGIKK